MRELVRDLEDHTGISKDCRPGVKTGALMNQIIKKSVAKLIKEEDKDRIPSPSDSNLNSDIAMELIAQPLNSSKNQHTSTASEGGLTTVRSNAKLIVLAGNSIDSSPSKMSNPLAEYITLNDSQAANSPREPKLIEIKNHQKLSTRDVSSLYMGHHEAFGQVHHDNHSPVKGHCVCHHISKAAQSS